LQSNHPFGKLSYMKITYEEKDYDVEPFDNLYGFKDGKLFQSWITTGSDMVCIGNCLGRLKFILDQDHNVLAMANPMFGFDNGFETYTKAELERYSAVCREYYEMFQRI
jgi:hypothetical protein